MNRTLKNGPVQVPEDTSKTNQKSQKRTSGSQEQTNTKKSS